MFGRCFTLFDRVRPVLVLSLIVFGLCVDCVWTVFAHFFGFVCSTLCVYLTSFDFLTAPSVIGAFFHVSATPRGSVNQSGCVRGRGGGGERQPGRGGARGWAGRGYEGDIPYSIRPVKTPHFHGPTTNAAPPEVRYHLITALLPDRFCRLFEFVCLRLFVCLTLFACLNVFA